VSGCDREIRSPLRFAIVPAIEDLTGCRSRIGRSSDGFAGTNLNGLQGFVAINKVVGVIGISRRVVFDRIDGHLEALAREDACSIDSQLNADGVTCALSDRGLVI
jgi:hypothetical protein